MDSEFCLDFHTDGRILHGKTGDHIGNFVRDGDHYKFVPADPSIPALPREYYREITNYLTALNARQNWPR